MTTVLCLACRRKQPHQCIVTGRYERGAPIIRMHGLAPINTVISHEAVQRYHEIRTAAEQRLEQEIKEHPKCGWPDCDQPAFSEMGRCLYHMD